MGNYLNLMKKAFALAAIAAVALVPQAEAADLTFLDGPYEFLDKVVMTFYKPLIWYIVIGWSQSAACDFITKEAISLFVTSDTMTDDEKTTMCKEGVEMYWEQFFYGGASGNKPYNLAWAWTPS